MNSRAVVAWFDALAPRWDAWKRKNRYYHGQLEQLCRSIIPPGSRVLELGCATGDLLEALQPSDGVGVDISPRMIELARAAHPRLRFEVADATQPPALGTFDYVVLSNLVGYLDDIWLTLRNLRALVRPDTRILLTYYNYLWEPLLKCAAALGVKTPLPPQNWLPLSDLANLLVLNEFDVIRQGRRLLLPVGIPVLSTLCNRFLAALPGFQRLGVIEYLVARPRLRDAERQEVTCSVIVPTRNEAGNIEELIRRTPQMGRHTELVFVDGHSTDGTPERIREAIERHRGQRDIRLVLQGDGKGKGHAVRLGFRAARGEVLMILDADLTVDPEDLEKFYRVIVEGHGELVMGSRLVYPMERQAMRFLNLLGNKFFSRMFSWLLEQRLTDTLCGTKVLRRTDYHKIEANRAFFGDFDPFGDFDLIFGAAKLNLKIAELPVPYRERSYGTTKINRFRHGWLLLRMCGIAMRKLKFAPVRPADDFMAVQQAQFERADVEHFHWQTSHPAFSRSEQALLSGSVARARRLLDVGCGEGGNLVNLFATGIEPPALTVGVDLFQEKVAFAAARLPGARFLQADAHALPFISGSFDAIICRDVLHHVEQPAEVVAEVARICPAGGRVVFIEPNGRNPLMWLLSRLRAFERGIGESSPQRLRDLISECFAQVRVEPRQALPIGRLVFHHQLGMPTFGRWRCFAALVSGAEALLGRLVPPSRWSYLVVEACDPRPVEPAAQSAVAAETAGTRP